MQHRVAQLLTLACTLAMAAPSFAQMAKVPGPVSSDSASTKSPHHGSWWRSKSNVYQEAYINGYKSGWHHAIGHDTPLHPFGASTVVAGIDKFYADFRNRLINVDDAIAYVSEELNGVDPDKLKAEVLKLRSAAAKGSDEE